LHARDVHHRGLFIGAAGNLQQIDTGILQPARDNHAFFKGKAALLEIGGIELHADGKLLARPRLAPARRQP